MALTEEEFEVVYGELFGNIAKNELTIERMMEVFEEHYMRKNMCGIPTKKVLQRILETFDRDNDGIIDFKELFEGLSRFGISGAKEEMLKFAFELYDINCDGIISPGELFATLQIMSGGILNENALQQIVDKTMRDADVDLDGGISFCEFKAVLRKTPRLFSIPDPAKIKSWK